MKIISLWGVAALALLCACNQNKQPHDTNMIPPALNFDHPVDGKNVQLFILKNRRGMEAAITNYGGRLVSLIVPDKEGEPVSVVAGFNDLDGYRNSTEPYFGATIGRYGNRIAKGQFSLNGQAYQLSVNNGPNTLHGGKKGFQYQVFDAHQQGDTSLVLTYHSPDGDNGFPGNLLVKVTYSLTDHNELKLAYQAQTDKETIINLTNHAFFNLNGEGSGKITGHILMIKADQYTPVDSLLIPTGKLQPVSGTPFDFTKPTTIGVRINDHQEQLHFGKGYDHNFVLSPHSPTDTVATAFGDKSGIIMKVVTTEPGLQFYSGNFMQGKNKMRAAMDDHRTAFCLETQHFPDSPNHPEFPSVVLKPGQIYNSQTSYCFSAQ